MKIRPLVKIFGTTITLMAVIALAPSAVARVDVRSDVRVDTGRGNDGGRESTRTDISIFHQINGGESQSFRYSTSSSSGSIRIEVDENQVREKIHEPPFERESIITPVTPLITRQDNSSLGQRTTMLSIVSGNNEKTTTITRMGRGVEATNKETELLLKNLTNLLDPIHERLLKLLILFA